MRQKNQGHRKIVDKQIVLQLHRKCSHWTSLGIPGPKPSIFKLGNLAEIAGPCGRDGNETAIWQILRQLLWAGARAHTDRC